MQPTTSDIALLAIVYLAGDRFTPVHCGFTRHQTTRLITMGLAITSPTKMDVILNPSTRVTPTPAGNNLLKKHNLHVFGQEKHSTRKCDPYLWSVFSAMIRKVPIYVPQNYHRAPK